MDRTPRAWGPKSARSPRGYPSPRAASPSILRSSSRGATEAARHGFVSSPSGGWYRKLDAKRVDLGGERQTRKEVREYVPGSAPIRRPEGRRAAANTSARETRRAAANTSARETREWRKHIEQKDRPFERSLRKTKSPSRGRRSPSPFDRSVRMSPGVTTSPRCALPSRRATQPATSKLTPPWFAWTAVVLSRPHDVVLSAKPSAT